MSIGGHHAGVSFHELKSALEAQPLFENKTWLLSPKPWPLTPQQVEELEEIGNACLEFHIALEYLYRRSCEGKNLLRNKPLQADWVHRYLDRGKPLRMLEHSRLKELKGDIPRVLRPDLLLTQDGWALTEMDSVPGGLGLTAFLSQLYARAGFPVVGGERGIPDSFYASLRTLRPQSVNPFIAIVVSDEASTYRPEFEYLASELRLAGCLVHVCHPDELMLMGDGLSIPVDGNPEAVEILYRFWELFDMGNIRTAQAIFKAVESGEVSLTPPMKPFQEEKLNLALLHHPILEPFWKENLSRNALQTLRKIVPNSWIIDPVDLPPNAVLDAPWVSGRPIRDWRQLGEASQKDRNLIIKASGFHETAWGARSVVLGSDHSRTEWMEAIENACAKAGQTPHILQEYRKPQRLEHPIFTPDGLGVNQAQVRVRICPYYLVFENEARLSGVLATACPADKKIIHGMSDAALLPCMVERP